MPLSPKIFCRRALMGKNSPYVLLLIMHGMAWHVLEGVTAVTVFQYGDFPVWFGIDSKIF